MNPALPSPSASTLGLSFCIMLGLPVVLLVPVSWLPVWPRPVEPVLAPRES